MWADLAGQNLNMTVKAGTNTQTISLGPVWINRQDTIKIIVTRSGAGTEFSMQIGGADQGDISGCKSKSTTVKSSGAPTQLKFADNTGTLTAAVAVFSVVADTDNYYDQPTREAILAGTPTAGTDPATLQHYLNCNYP